MLATDDSEWEEEECYLLVEISGIIDMDIVSNCKDNCRIMNLNSDKPVMQLGNYLFMGEYRETQGTAVIFEQNADEQSVKYKCQTTKKLVMNRAFLKQKHSTATTSVSEKEMPSYEDAPPGGDT